MLRCRRTNEGRLNHSTASPWLKVTGDVAGLVPLVKLDYVFFGSTKTVTSRGAFCGASGPFDTHCKSNFGCVCSC